MPRYAYHCPTCGYENDFSKSVEDRDDPVSCSSCGAPMTRKIGAFSVHQAKGTFRPQNLAQQLAGRGVVTPQYSTATSVLRR